MSNLHLHDTSATKNYEEGVEPECDHRHAANELGLNSMSYGKIDV